MGFIIKRYKEILECWNCYVFDCDDNYMIISVCYNLIEFNI